MKKKGEKLQSSPIIRMRILGIGLALLTVLISGPLLAVWKQASINYTSLQLSILTDSLSSVQKNIAAMRFTYEHYSSTERIEKIARDKLDLEYPVSSQIVIIRTEKREQPKLYNAPKEFLAYLKRAFTGDKG